MDYTALNGVSFVFDEQFGFLLDVSAGTLSGLSTLLGGVEIINVCGWNIDAATVYDLGMIWRRRATARGCATCCCPAATATTICAACGATTGCRATRAAMSFCSRTGWTRPVPTPSPISADHGRHRPGRGHLQGAGRLGGGAEPGALVYDADGNGAGAGVQVATLAAGLAMTADSIFRVF